MAEAVLIRALQPVSGEEWMHANRPGKSPRDLTNGPAKLCEALDIDRKLDGANLCDADSPLFIAGNPAAKKFIHRSGPMTTATRVGLSQAEHLPLRFYLAGSEYVSRRAARADANHKVRKR